MNQEIWREFLPDSPPRLSLAKIIGESAAAQVMAVNVFSGPVKLKIEGPPVTLGKSPFSDSYDKIVKNTVQSMAKRLDKSAKVTDGMALEDPGASTDGVQSWVLPITEQMRERATGEGLSLFDKTNTTPGVTGPRGALANPVPLEALEAMVEQVRQAIGDRAKIEVILAGGMLRKTDGGIVGEAAVDFITQFKVDHAVIGASAIDEDGAMLDFDYREVRVAKAIMCANAESVSTSPKVARIAAVDSTFPASVPPTPPTSRRPRSTRPLSASRLCKVAPGPVAPTRRG
jgi:hypothetical protein